MARSKRLHNKATEVWNVKRVVSDGQGGQSLKTVQITKVAVRVRAGAVGGNRPGTFHGATNFRPRSGQVSPE